MGRNYQTSSRIIDDKEKPNKTVCPSYDDECQHSKGRQSLY